MLTLLLPAAANDAALNVTELNQAVSDGARAAGSKARVKGLAQGLSEGL